MFIYSRFESLIHETGVTKASIARRIGRTPTVCQDWKAGMQLPSEREIAAPTSPVQRMKKTSPPARRPTRRTRSTRDSGNFFLMLTMI